MVIKSSEPYVTCLFYMQTSYTVLNPLRPTYLFYMQLAKTVQLQWWSQEVIKGSEPPVSLPVLQANPLGLHSVAVIKAGGYQRFWTLCNLPVLHANQLGLSSVAVIKAGGYQRFWTPCDLLTCSTCRPAKTVQLLWSRQVIKGSELPVTFLPVLHADQLRQFSCDQGRLSKVLNPLWPSYLFYVQTSYDSSVAAIEARGYRSISKSCSSVFWKNTVERMQDVV